MISCARLRPGAALQPRQGGVSGARYTALPASLLRRCRSDKGSCWIRAMSMLPKMSSHFAGGCSCAPLPDTDSGTPPERGVTAR